MDDWRAVFDRPPLTERTVGTGESTSAAVIEAVASVSNSRNEDLPPLYDAVDPDLLERGFVRADHGLIAFPYGGYVVSVEADRTVAVYDR